MNVRSKKKRQLILDATMELIAENGLHNTPMSLVSKRSGVSTGSIYHYFESKDDIINHLYLEKKKEIMNAIFKDYNADAPFKKRFFHIWKNYYDYLIENPSQLSFVEQCSTSPLISEKTKEESREYYMPLIEFTEEGIKSGISKNTDVMLILNFVHGSVVSTAKLQFTGMVEIDEELRETAAQFCWDGLKA
jgi:AcrR family transcriptional regulator